MLAYLSVVVDTEWARMEHRQGAPEAARLFEQMVGSVAKAELAVPHQRAARGQMLALLASAHQYRETRLFQMTQAVPPLIWVLLIGLGTALVGFLLCFGIEYVWSQVTFTGIFAAAVAFVLVIVHLLDFPFEGALRLSPRDFWATREKIALMLGTA
ncbi:MAG: DUF4239 domain-containing protein, partial [Acetobacteraceae bacterium]|nr:DUF4239 domain-containing protein [Acetobacteraceae bacterium]